MGRFKEKTTVTEKIPLDAVVDDSEKPPEAAAQPEEEITPSEQRYLDVARRIAGYGLKFKVFRIVDGGAERYIKSLTAEQFDTENPEGSLRTYFGGGMFKVYFLDPESREEISGEFEIEGEPKLVKEELAPGGGLTLNMPKQGADATAVAMMNFMSTQLSKNQELVNTLIVKLADNKSNSQQGALVGGMTLEQLGIIKELFASKKGDDSGEKLKEWIGLARTLVDNIAPIIQPQSDNPVMTFFSMIAPKVSEVMQAYLNSKQKPGAVPQARPAAVGATGAAVAAPTQQQQPPAEGADVIRQVFEQMYFTPLLEAAKEDLDPYAMTFNFKAQLGDTTQFLPALGLTSVSAFYERYPESQNHRVWFDEFFYFMLNPSAKPEMDEEEEEAEAQPPNGSAKDVVVETEVVDAPVKKKAKKETEIAEQKQ